MITRQDILDRAAEWHLRPDVVEKDYVLGWLLAGIGRHEHTSRFWVFKGGTALKKCYFETFRFSEDLDFSLLPQAAYAADEVKAIVADVARSVTEMSGIAFVAEELMVVPRQNRQGQETFELRIEYRGPLAGPSRPKVRFDLTRHEPILDTPVRAQVLHGDYPDVLPGKASVLTYSLEELVAEKTRALIERTLPRDLYDVVLVLDNHGDALKLERTRSLLQQKCKGKGMAAPSAAGLQKIVAESGELRSEWENMLAHQLPALPGIDSVLGRLGALVSWIDAPTPLPITRLARASMGASRDGVLEAPRAARYWGVGAPLDLVRFAGANRLIIEFSYDGKARAVEPYSFRRPKTGNLLMYGWELGSTHIKAFNVVKMSGVRVGHQVFMPRYRVEFTG